MVQVQVQVRVIAERRDRRAIGQRSEERGVLTAVRVRSEFGITDRGVGAHNDGAGRERIDATEATSVGPIDPERGADVLDVVKVVGQQTGAGALVEHVARCASMRRGWWKSSSSH